MTIKTLLLVYDEVNNVLSIQNSPTDDGYVCAFEVATGNKKDEDILEYLVPKFLGVYEQSSKQPADRGQLTSKEVDKDRLVELKEKK